VPGNGGEIKSAIKTKVFADKKQLYDGSYTEMIKENYSLTPFCAGEMPSITLIINING
jgi:hypothetical protein